MLLTTSNDLPAVTASAIDRLDPDTVVVVGGVAAVDDAVLDRLGAMVPTVERVAGGDRFATAAAVADRWFRAEGRRAYVAPGSSAIDAAIAGAAAARDGAPLLLAGDDSLGDDAADELRRLAPSEVVVVGVPVTGSVRARLESMVSARGVIEVAGSDRYETAAMLTGVVHQRAPALTVVASGVRAIDAAVAGATGAAVLLSSSTMSAATLDELERLAAGGDVHVVGGETAVGDQALQAALDATLIAVSPRFVHGALPGVAMTVLVRATPRPGDAIALEASVTSGTVSVGATSLPPGGLTEVTFVPPAVAQDETVVLTVAGTRAGVTVSRTREIVVMPDVDTREADARAVLGLFLPSLEASHPELGLDASMADTIAGSVVAPRLLVVSHYQFLDDEWELGVAWHVMVPPDDWAELYLRRRGELLPTVAFRISSWSTALAGGTATVRLVDPPVEVVR